MRGGLRGLPRAVGEALLEARAAGPFVSLPDLVRRTRLSRAWLLQLAEAGALGPLAGDRRSAVWRSLGLEADGGDLFAGLAPPEPLQPVPSASPASTMKSPRTSTTPAMWPRTILA